MLRVPSESDSLWAQRQTLSLPRTVSATSDPCLAPTWIKPTSPTSVAADVEELKGGDQGALCQTPAFFFVVGEVYFCAFAEQVGK